MELFRAYFLARNSKIRGVVIQFLAFDCIFGHPSQELLYRPSLYGQVIAGVKKSE